MISCSRLKCGFYDIALEGILFQSLTQVHRLYMIAFLQTMCLCWYHGIINFSSPWYYISGCITNNPTTLMPFTFKRHWEFIEKRFLLRLLYVDKLLTLYIQHFENSPPSSTTVVKWIFDMASVVEEGEQLLRHNTAIEFHLKLNKFYYMACYLSCVSINIYLRSKRSDEIEGKGETCSLSNVKLNREWLVGAAGAIIHNWSVCKIS